MALGKHKYPSHNVVDSAVGIVAGAGGIMACGSHHNKLAEYDEIEVQNEKGLGKSEGTDWHNLGCYLKPRHMPNIVFNPKLNMDLLSFFLDGEKKKAAIKKANQSTPKKKPSIS